MKAPIEEINAFVDRNKEEMLLFWEQLVNRQAGSKRSGPCEPHHAFFEGTF